MKIFASFKVKFLLGVLVCLLCLNSYYFYDEIKTTNYEIEENLKYESILHATLMSDFILSYYKEGNIEKIRNIMSWSYSRKNLKHSMFIEPNQNIYMANKYEWVSKELKTIDLNYTAKQKIIEIMNSLEPYEFERIGNTLKLFYPFWIGDNLKGKRRALLYMSFDLELPLKRAFNRALMNTFIFSIITLLISTILAIFFLKRINWELNTVIEFAQDMSKGNFEVTLEKSNIEELDPLYKSLNQMRKDLKVTDMAKRNFLAMISHELRTPISGMINTLQLLEQTELDDEQKRYYDFFQMSTKRLSETINEILDFSKISSESIKPKSESFEFRRLFKDCISLIRKGKDNHNTFSLSFHEDIPKYIESDYRFIFRAVQNILSNANKFTKNGMITISVSSQKETDEILNLKIEVKDTGKGISKKNQKRLFDAFYQEDNSLTRSYEGVGLGLPIVKSIVNLLNGRVELESEENRGTTISLILPVKIGEKPEVEQNLSGSFTLGSYNILVADDDLINQKTMELILGKMGHSVDIANNGLEAVEKFNKKSYDYIFLDLRMPVMDGFEAAEKIINMAKQMGLSPEIIMLTGDVLEENQEKAKEIGINLFLTKPFDFEVIENIFKKVA